MYHKFDKSKFIKWESDTKLISIEYEKRLLEEINCLRSCVSQLLVDRYINDDSWKKAEELRMEREK
jgi:hypothetical protein